MKLKRNLRLKSLEFSVHMPVGRKKREVTLISL